MPKKRSVCPRYNKKLQRMSKRLKVPQSPVINPADVSTTGMTQQQLDGYPGVIGIGPDDHCALPIPDGEYKLPDGTTVILGPSALFSLDDLLPKD